MASAVLVAAAWPATAAAQTGVYAGVTLSKVFAATSAGTSPNTTSIVLGHGSESGIGAAVGYRFGIPMRVEGEFTYVDSKTDEVIVNGVDARSTTNGTHDMMFTMVNVLYDVARGNRATYFVGGGAGVSNDRRDISFVDTSGRAREINDRETHTAIQLKAGTAVNLSAGVDLTVAYRFARTEDRSFGGTLKLEPARLHFLEVGLRFGFGR